MSRMTLRNHWTSHPPGEDELGTDGRKDEFGGPIVDNHNYRGLAVALGAVVHYPDAPLRRAPDAREICAPGPHVVLPRWTIADLHVRSMHSSQSS